MTSRPASQPSRADTNSIAPTDTAPDSAPSDSTTPDWFRRAIAHEPASDTVTVDGARIHYLRWSAPQDAPDTDHDATPVLLVPGNGAHARWWSFIAPFLAARGRAVAALDLGGMGDSDDSPAPGLDPFARQVASVAERIGGGGKVALVGHSFGGLVSSATAIARPELVARLVAIDSSYHVGNRKSHPPPRQANAVHADEASILSRFRLVPAQPVEPACVLDFIARHSIMPAPGGGWTWKFRTDPWTMPGLDKSVWRQTGERLQRFTGPKAYLRGGLSPVPLAEIAAAWRDFAGPAAPFIVIPQARHHAILDQPLAIVAALETLFATTQA